jgi:molybdopterin synthase catalytic subunit
MMKVTLQKEPINIEPIISETSSDADGALVTFTGMARNLSDGRRVTRLEYECYDSMARKELEKIGSDALAQWPVTNCVIVHRFGVVEIGESSILIAVSSPHRDEAFQAVRYIIDTIKKTVPIWKKEFYSDGGVWVSDRS